MTRLLPEHPQSNPSATLEQLLGGCTVPVGLLQVFLEVFGALLRDHNVAPRVPGASAAPVKQQALLIWLQLLCLCVVVNSGPWLLAAVYRSISFNFDKCFDMNSAWCGKMMMKLGLDEHCFCSG